MKHMLQTRSIPNARWVLSTSKAIATLSPISLATLVRVVAGRSGAAKTRMVRWASENKSYPDVVLLPGGRIQTALCSLFGIGIGLVGWLGLLLAGPNTIRNVFLYGFFDGGSTQDSWGGPSLLGAWATHAAIAIALVPVYLVIFEGLLALQCRLVSKWVMGASVRAWVLPVSTLVVAGGALFLVALINQAHA